MLRLNPIELCNVMLNIRPKKGSVVSCDGDVEISEEMHFRMMWLVQKFLKVRSWFSLLLKMESMSMALS